MGNEYQDSTLRADDVRVDTYSAGVGREERTWYKPWTWRNSEYVIEKHSFNRFQDDEVPSLAIRRTEQHSTGPRQERSADGKCWTEEQVETFEYITRVYIKKRWIEWWKVNKSLEAYYEFVDDFGKNAADAANALEAPIRHVSRLSGQPSIAPTTAITGGAVGATATLVRMAPGMIAQGEAALAAAGEMAAAAGAGGALPGLADAAAVGATELGGIAATGAGYGLSAVGTAASAVASVAVPAAVISGVAVVSFVGTTEIMKKYVEAAEKISEGWEFVARYHGPEELVRQSIGWERVGPIRDCPPKQKKPVTGTGWLPWWPWPWWWFFPFFILLVLIGVALWLLFGAGDDGTHVTTGPITEVPAAASSTSPPAAASATATPQVVSGGYKGAVTVGDDPAGHACCVKPTGTWTVLQVRNTQTNAITITLSDILPGITLTGPVPASGQQFTAAGTGTVAGYPNVVVSFTGSVSAEAGLAGVLTVGGNGALPQAKAITFNVKMTKAP